MGVQRTGLMHFPIQPVRCTPFQKTRGLLYIENLSQFHTLLQRKVVFMH